MNRTARSIVILGATGSIGRNALEVAETSRGRIRVLGATAHQRLNELCEFAQALNIPRIVATSREAAEGFDWSQLAPHVEVSVGTAAVEELVAVPDVDVVIVAIVGSAGLRGTWAALEAGKTVALANKETLVMAGPLVTGLARNRNAALIPIDSEHSAIFQCLQSGRREEVKRVFLTASGGPFREYTSDQLEKVAVEDALAHPTWDMGPKITVDSATMMNKALEIIEARWLFDLEPDQIEVVVHPQSIVHSMVEFVDGSTVAQLSPPDMRLPIQYAISYPERWESPTDRLNLTKSLSLEFEPPDRERFPALTLGFEVARVGGTAGAVLNAANEAAVARFLEGHLEFAEIVPVCRSVLEQHTFDAEPSLEQLIELDTWSRREVSRWSRT